MTDLRDVMRGEPEPPEPPEDASRRELNALFVQTVVFAALAVAGLWFGHTMRDQQQLLWDAQSFRSTPCVKVTTSALAHAHRSGRRSSSFSSSYWYEPVLTCDYVVGGATYRIDSTAVELPFPTTINNSVEDANGVAQRYAAAHPPVAFYDPQTPSRGAMARNAAIAPAVVVDNTYGLLAIGGGICALLAALWSVLLVRRLWRRHVDRRAAGGRS